MWDGIMTNTPDRWVMIKVDHPAQPVFYKIFGTWAGGYLDGDSWRLNSGVDKVVIHTDWFDFQGFSGSSYKCGKNSYGIAGAYNSPALRTLIEDSKGVLKVLDEEEAMQVVEDMVG